MAGVSTKDIKLRIRSMESTKQITKAMEMVAASKLRRAQERVQKSEPYADILYDALCDIAVTNTDFSSVYTRYNDSDKICYIVIAGDRGLAGGYNHNVLKLALERMAGKNVCVLPIGRKALEFFRARNYEIVTDAYAEAATLTMSKCFTMARNVCQDFKEGKYGRVRLIYTNYISVMSQEPNLRLVLPIIMTGVKEKRPKPTGGLIEYEPSAEEVFDSITPECIGGLIYGALCEAIASELGARRTAMDAATKNAEEMIEGLNLEYNRARQAAITQELTEIVAGADA